MHKTPILIAALLAPLAIGACQVETANSDNTGNAAMPQPGLPNATAPVDGSAPTEPNAPDPATPTPTPGSAPAPTPDPSSIPASEKTPAAAKAVLDRYFAALATKQYGKAYRMWSGGGRASGMTEAEFAASFARYKIYDGRAFGAGDQEGAAGSSYIEFPVTVTGLLAKGGGFHLSGPMTLKRVNDVDGATFEQLHWHLSSSGLTPRP